MEITLSRTTILKVILLSMIAALLYGAYLAWSEEIVQGWFTKTPQPSETSFANEPALQSLAILYSPAGERSDWEEQACRGMTEQGCELFHAMFADPLWEASVEGKTADIRLIAIVETLDDGTQVWKTNVTVNGSSQPVYIHVAQAGDGRWLLNRVLFAQEAAKYEDLTGILP